MKKKDLSCFVIVLLLSLLILLPQNIQAQNVAFEKDALENYIKFSTLPDDQKREMFARSTVKIRSDLWKVNLSLYLVRHSTLNNNQKDFIAELASILNLQMFDNFFTEQNTIALRQRASQLFPPNEVAELIAKLGGKPEDLPLLQSYQFISRISLSKRKDVFFSASPFEKSRLWKLHLGLKFVTHTELNKNQKNLIFYAAELAAPETFQFIEGSQNWQARIVQPYQTLAKEVVSNFSNDKNKAKNIFFELGDPQLFSIDEPPIDEPVDPNGGSTCKCTIGYADACFTDEGKFCDPTLSCTKKTKGCGILWQFPCDGAKCV